MEGIEAYGRESESNEGGVVPRCSAQLEGSFRENAIPLRSPSSARSSADVPNNLIRSNV